MRLNYGFRAVNVENTAAQVVGAVKTGTIEADEPFLPQVGINWTINDSLGFFTSAAKNVRAFASSGTSGPFGTTADGSAAIRDVVEPETATRFEAGLRFRASNTVEGLVALFNVDFQDRLLGITQGAGIVGNPSVLANVGGVTTSGLQAALTGSP